MKIAFVSIGFENLAVEYLASLLKKEGHEVKLFFDPSLFDDKYIFSNPSISKIFDIRKYIINNLIDYCPNLVAFSVFTDSYIWALNMAREIKKHCSVPIIFGGIHPTSVPDVVIHEKCVDMINIGEGLESLPELARLMSREKEYYSVQNIWFKKTGNIIKNNVRPLFTELDRLPFPDKELFRGITDSTGNYQTITSLGCPYRCAFCCNDIWLSLYDNSRFLRRWSPDYIIAELKLAKKSYKIKTVVFVDDIFTIDSKWLEIFMPAYKKEIKLPFEILSHVKCIDDNIVKMLKRSGCYRVEFGIQSINESTRKNVLNRQETNEEIEKALKICEKNKLAYRIDHMFGIPTEGKKQQVEAVKFYSNFKPSRISQFYLVYYPKIGVTNIATKMKVLTATDIKNIEKGYVKNYHSGGSVKNRKQLELYRTFSALFLLMPLMPKWLNRRIAHSKLILKFHIRVPKLIHILLDFLGGIRYRDRYIIGYVKYYIKTIVKVMLIKLFKLRYR